MRERFSVAAPPRLRRWLTETTDRLERVPRPERRRIAELPPDRAHYDELHDAAVLADGLDMGYAFAADAVRLPESGPTAGGLGPDADLYGPLGGAILFGPVLHRLGALRVDMTGRWFTAAHGRRLGGTIALFAQCQTGAGPVTLALDPGVSTAERRRQIVAVLEQLDAYDPLSPALVALDPGDGLADAPRRPAALRPAARPPRPAGRGLLEARLQAGRRTVRALRHNARAQAGVRSRPHRLDGGAGRAPRGGGRPDRRRDRLALIDAGTAPPHCCRRGGALCHLSSNAWGGSRECRSLAWASRSVARKTSA